MGEQAYEQRRFDEDWDVIADILETCLSLRTLQDGSARPPAGWLAKSFEKARQHAAAWAEGASLSAVRMQHLAAPDALGLTAELVYLPNEHIGPKRQEPSPASRPIWSVSPYAFSFLTWDVPEKLTIHPSFVDDRLLAFAALTPGESSTLPEIIKSEDLKTLIVIYLALRAFVSGAVPLSRGWPAGLAERQIGQALSLLHGSPGAEWTVTDLANHVGADRSRFANRFTHVIGCAPMKYLTKWRMVLAERRLRESDESIASLAQSLGYQRQSSFGAVFKEHFGLQPSVHRAQGRLRSRRHDHPELPAHTSPGCLKQC